MSERAAATDAIEMTPTLRRPAPELGPRARRTIDLILAATKEVFLARGYGGTSIDDIARAAGVSRASFYTYFPSKRDALLALGADAGHHAELLIDELATLPETGRAEAIAAWVARYFAFLDDYGSFALAWPQAAHQDDELRAAGMRGHLATCRRFGKVLESLGSSSLGDPAHLGLLVFSMLERTWAQCRLYRAALDEREVCADAGVVITAVLSGRPIRRREGG